MAKFNIPQKLIELCFYAQFGVRSFVLVEEVDEIERVFVVCNRQIPTNIGRSGPTFALTHTWTRVWLEASNVPQVT
jgi:hypothetical protein